jgi:hypothetical protein
MRLQKADPMKIFTLDEAQSLLPVLEALLRRAIENQKSADQIEQKISKLARRIYLYGGMRVNVTEVAGLRAEMDTCQRRVRESVSEIDSIGVQVKDLPTGQLDFPCRLDSQVVLLSWHMGEPSIEHWRDTDSDSDERLLIDERFHRRSTPGGRPN